MFGVKIDSFCGIADGPSVTRYEFVPGEKTKLAKIAELEGRIRALEAGEKAETDPAYVPGKWYWRGDRVTENGVSYVCIAPENVVCTWSPSDYPAYWEQAQ